MHGLWHLPPALRIAEALEAFDLSWIEDPVRLDDLAALQEYTEACASPVAAGETLGGVGAFRDLIERRAVDVPIIDIGWGGGLTVARKVAALADAARRPVAAHDCTGPVALATCVHFALHCQNVAEQEIARAFYYGWYDEMVTQRPPIENGAISAPPGPGLGLELRPDFLDRDDVHVTRSEPG
jgi:L-alanine-DL-glutamate epimerase-like enolase superfamily enzyme